ncbi:uncharacterized protein N7525_009994 [Penicillium rubens]|uniref:Uncharacterized protein n=1 Tax=Penicillium chrysogenum TaxID=5076 RepID=A0ABQ8WP91_PENCH|nr:uncharacterized protein N7525_009994 [Penicillium rubens]KAJ5274188.1 hypothetical protein N7505_002733 [Penicillium chrysogenum]KAJ5820710.1 hypothetical protein N7525_009994 [Penicillium rubens]KAJ6136685.1 hypothetical protein N7497_012389 [Penicillium chrysogenum]KAJ6136761.1 hypothetical protein N7497_012314 [Penicillium chrysogenum]
MSLESFSRGNADFGRSAANGSNFIGRSGNTRDDRYRSALVDPKRGNAANLAWRRTLVDPLRTR